MKNQLKYKRLGPVDLKAKLVKTIASVMKVNAVMCKDSSVASALKAVNTTIGDSVIVWAATPSEVKANAGTGKLILCGKLDELPLGGCIAIVEEGGKPAIYIHVINVQKNNITLPDAILKIGKPLK